MSRVDAWSAVLVNSVWAAALAAIVVAVVLRFVSTARPDLRAGVAYAGLLAALVGSLASLLPDVSLPPVSHGREAPTVESPNAAPLPVAPAVVDASPVGPIAVSPSWRRAIVGAWLVGAAVMLLRLGRSHWAARRVLSAECVRPSTEVTRLLDEVASALRVARRVGVRVTDRVTTPLVAGLLSPVVVLPASVVSGLPPDALRVILAHELWHVRRGDLWLGLGQQCVEAVLFYHPAVWWMSAQFQREREAACDAAAARLVGDARPVARALVDTAEVAMRGPVFGLALGRGFLPERVARLLSPNQRPAGRWPIAALVGGLLLGTLSLLALTTGTRMVAREVIVAMTPAERVAAIEEVMKQDGAPKVDPGDALGEKVPSYEVTGRVVAPDGEERPRWGVINITRKGVSGTLSYGADGSFTTRVPANTDFYLSPNIVGYTPECYGPFRTDEGPVDVGNILIRRGHSSRLIVRDTQGRPVEGARIVSAFARIRFSQGGMGTGVSELEDLTSDAAGIIRLVNLPNRPLDITIEKAGYERLTKETTFAPGGEESWRLTKTKPLVGRFVDTTGRPVAGVEVHCVRSEGDSPNRGDPRTRFIDPKRTGLSPMTTSDVDGRFQLDSLKAEATYWLLALHEEHAPKRLDGVTAGQDLKEIALSGPFNIAGTIRGDLSAVLPEGQPRAVYLTNPLTYDGMSYSDYLSVPVDDSGSFLLRQLLPGSMILTVGEHKLERQIDASTDDLVIDVDRLHEWGQENHRTVRVRIVPPGDQPVRGTVWLQWRHDELQEVGPQSTNRQLLVPEDDPVVEMRAPIGATMWIQGDRLIGSHLESKNLGELPEGEEPYELSVEAKAAGLVVGRVVDARGEPLADCKVTVRSAEKGGGLKTWDDDRLTADGGFSVSGVPLSDEQRYACEVQLKNSWRFAFSEPFRVSAEKPIREIEVVMPDPVFLTGQLVGPDGAPATDRRIAMSRQMANFSGSGGFSAEVDEEGRFRIAISPDRKVKHHGLEVVPAKGLTGATLKYEPGLLNNGRDFGRVQLKPASTVSGTIVYEDGTPAVDFRFPIMPMDSAGALYAGALQTSTNANGRFLIENAERTPQRFFYWPKSEVVSVEPESCRTTDKLGNPWFVVTPGPNAPELRFVIRKVD